VMLLQLLPGLRLGAQLSAAPAADTQRNATALAMPTQEAMKAAEAPQLSAPSAESATQPPWGDSSGVISSGQALGRGGGGGGGDGGGGSGQFATGPGIVTYNQDKIGSPMAGGAADTAISPAPNGGIVNYGGQPSPDQNPASNTYTPPYALPPQSAGALPEEQPAQSVAPSNSPGLEGAGPILGVPSSDEAGKIIAEGPVTPASEPAPSQADSGQQVAKQPAVPFWSTTRILQAGLLGLAVLAGVTAFLVRRRMS